VSVERIRVRSAALAGNPLGDPAERDLWVVAPEGHDPRTPAVCVWYLAGYAGVGAAMLSHDPWQEGLEERLARLTNSGAIGGPLIVALPDAFTRYGGSQYLSSSAHGDYERYLWSELVGALEARFSVRARAVVGKSSGGFGALTAALYRPGLFQAMACHSGDIGFDLALRPDLPALMNAIREHGSLEAFVAAFARTSKKKESRWLNPMSVLAMSAAYSPDPARPLGVALPFDLAAGRIDEAVFARWKAHDPLQAIERPECQAALRTLRLCYLDCGLRDEYHLQWGARAFARRLAELGIPHQHEEFEDGHRGTGYRLDVSLPKVWQALAR
jgi:enterochelin esterase family protein